MSREIPVGHDRVTVVDDEDFEAVGHFNWFCRKSGNVWYAQRQFRRQDGGRGMLPLHRFIMGIDDPAVYIDHVNGDGLDNRRANLRLATNQQNRRNTHCLKRGKTSQYKGVCRHVYSGKWTAQIVVSKKKKHLGLFATEYEAAIAYDIAAREMFGEFARTNF